MSDPIAYTYNADTHCPACTLDYARERDYASDATVAAVRAWVWGDCDDMDARYHSWGIYRAWFLPALIEDGIIRDSEGNQLHPVAPWDEYDPATGIYCGTCGCEIVESLPYTVIENTPGYLPDDLDPARFHTFREAVRYMIELVRDYRDSLRDPDGWLDRTLGQAYMRDASRNHDLGRSFEVIDTPNL